MTGPGTDPGDPHAGCTWWAGYAAALRDLGSTTAARPVVAWAIYSRDGALIAVTQEHPGDIRIASAIVPLIAAERRQGDGTPPQPTEETAP